jgi:hypothetical protein
MDGKYWKGTVYGLWLLAARQKWRLAEPKTAPEAELQLRASKDDGWLYADPEAGSQNGNSGLRLSERSILT